MTHTATPWRIERGDSIVSVTANDVRIAATCTKAYHEKFDDTDLANAAFIVKAVNSFDDLVEALKFYAQGTGNPSGHDREPEDYEVTDYPDGSSRSKPYKFGERARAVLAKVQS